MKDFSKEMLIEYNHLYRTYHKIDDFLHNHPSMTYAEFDYYSCRDFSIFSLEVDFNFKTLSETIKKIEDALPSIKRIFAKPIIHLKDTENVLPVESVRTTGQKTILYAATHSETIENITKKGIKPRKLLTKEYEDNYGIYENVVFCNIIDDILSYTRRNWKTLKALLYNSKVLELNLLERVNHLYFFLSLGKLHTGYVRDYGKYYSEANQDLEKLNFIYDAIQIRLGSAIYRKNKKRNRALSVKKTNIFKMQKDYHKVYNLYRFFQSKGITGGLIENVPMDNLATDYFEYCIMLCLFALGNFNFVTENKPIDMLNPDVTFTFRQWKIRLSVPKPGVILLETYNNRLFRRLAFLPTVEPLSECKGYVEKVYNESCTRIMATPFEDGQFTDGFIFLSKEDIESFRRIQQYVLREMIYTDVERKYCPFCGEEINYDTKKKRFECISCRTIVESVFCPKVNRSFFQSRISGFEPKEVAQAEKSKRRNWRLSADAEGLFHYRNITRINTKGDILCPYCNKVH